MNNTIDNTIDNTIETEKTLDKTFEEKMQDLEYSLRICELELKAPIEVKTEAEIENLKFYYLGLQVAYNIFTGKIWEEFKKKEEFNENNESEPKKESVEDTEINEENNEENLDNNLLKTIPYNDTDKDDDTDEEITEEVRLDEMLNESMKYTVKDRMKAIDLLIEYLILSYSHLELAYIQGKIEYKYKNDKPNAEITEEQKSS